MPDPANPPMGRLDAFDVAAKKLTHIAQHGKTPAHLLAIVKMMADRSVAPVNRHYFNIEPELMQELVLGWKCPDVRIPPLAAADLFGVEQTPICSAPLVLVS